jgi:alanyl-tRNA synthetase
MIESVMYFGIGFLVATLLGLLFIPLVHNRAVRLTTKRLEASTPLSMVEIRADKDHLRAEFAMSTRRLEMTIEELKAKTSTQLAELGKKTDANNQLKKELAEKKVTNVALEARDRKLRDQLRITEEELQIKSSTLLEAARELAEKEAELAKALGQTRRAIAGRQLICKLWYSIFRTVSDVHSYRANTNDRSTPAFYGFRTIRSAFAEAWG